MRVQDAANMYVVAVGRRKQAEHEERLAQETLTHMMQDQAIEEVPMPNGTIKMVKASSVRLSEGVKTEQVQAAVERKGMLAQFSKFNLNAAKAYAEKTADDFDGTLEIQDMYSARYYGK